MKKQVKTTDKDLVLTFLFGWTGYWRFKCGQVGLGILWLLTFGCFLIGWLVDIFACLAAIQRSRKNALQKSSSVYPLNSPILLNPRTMIIHRAGCHALAGAQGLINTTDIFGAERNGYKRCGICMKNGIQPQFVPQQRSFQQPQVAPTYTDSAASSAPFQTVTPSYRPSVSSPPPINALTKPHFGDFLEGQEKTYVYENVELYIVLGQEPNFSKIGLHEFVDFVQEPDNTYDNKAVYAVLDGQKLGYFKKNRLQDMMNDYIRRSDCDVIGYVSQVDFASRKITLDIAFYRDVEILSKVKLTACKGQDAQAALSYASEDDIVTIEYDYLKEAYIVSDDMGTIIGQLPKSLNSKLEEYDDIKGYICSIELDDNSKYVPTVAVY